MKGKIKAGNNNLFRKVLVIIQFSICLLLVVSSLMVIKQLKFMDKIDLGFDKENILLIPIDETDIALNFDNFSNKLKEKAGVINVTGTWFIPGVNISTVDFEPEGVEQNTKKLFYCNIVKHSFLETFDIEMVSGRSFSKDFPSDNNNAVIINESMVKHLGWTNEDAIMRNFYFDGREKVIGVMKDFHFTSLREPIKPLAITIVSHKNIVKRFTKHVVVKIDGKNNNEVISYIKKTWDEMSLPVPFKYSYLNDEINNVYSDENKLLDLSILFTIISILLATMGVYVLIVTVTNKQKRIIGIKKVLGADKKHLLKVFLKDYVIALFIASCISFSLAFKIMKGWLQNYSYRINIDVYPFLISIIVLAFITIMIVTLQTIRAADANPVDSIKSE